MISQLSIISSFRAIILIHSSMTGELLHETVLPVLPDIEDDYTEAPVIHDICVNYDGRSGKGEL